MTPKDIRKQVRNVIQEVKADILGSEIGQAIEKGIKQQLESRLTAIDAYVRSELEKQDKRAKDVQGFMVQIVKGTVQSSLRDFDLTIQAIVEVLADSGLVVADFDAKVKEKKAEINKAREDAAGAKLIDETASRAADAPAQAPVIPPADQVADAQPSTETPAQA